MFYITKPLPTIVRRIRFGFTLLKLAEEMLPRSSNIFSAWYLRKSIGLRSVRVWTSPCMRRIFITPFLAEERLRCGFGSPSHRGHIIGMVFLLHEFEDVRQLYDQTFSSRGHTGTVSPPVWIRRCRRKLDFGLNFFKQRSHWNGLLPDPWTVSRRTCKLPFRPKPFRHQSHWNSFIPESGWMTDVPF